MIPELGHFALILAMLLALAQGTLPIIGAHKGVAEWMALARPAAQAQFVFVLFAWCCLVASFVADDFSVANVAQNGNTLLPVAYKVAASWGSHEGSLLLWVLMLSGWGVAVAVFSRHLPQEMVSRVLGVMGLVAVGFILFMLATSDPFDRLFPPPAEGRDLNPLLQDPGMVFHPPLLYMGYVGFSVAFAFAIAALIGGKLDAAWARWSRPWTTVAWCFLTLGIALGSWWAYYELGWGGWWFWDPVENASFMPWLVGTALVHSLAVTEKRGTFKAWTVLLAIFAFSLSLLGTFLVRSGVLTSVHAFATDPARGVFILGFLVVVIGASLALFAWRAPRVGLGGSFDAVSRESMLLGNNVLLTVACGTVLLGTLYPLFLDALGLGKISVGPPYFDRVFVPVMAPLVFLMGVGPIARWKSADFAGAGPAAALRRQDRGWAAVVADGGVRLLDGGMDRRHLARADPPADPQPVRQPADAAGGAAARLVGHDAGTPRHCGVHHRRHLGQGLRGRARREDVAGRHGRRARLHLPLRQRRRAARAQLQRRPRHGDADEERQGDRHPASGEAHLLRAVADADDRGVDPHRGHRRCLRLAR